MNTQYFARHSKWGSLSLWGKSKYIHKDASTFRFFTQKSNPYSSEKMTTIANELTEDFIASAPKLERTYNRDEIYLFCCWILLDFGQNYGYLNKNSNINDFFDTIFRSIRNVEKKRPDELTQFTYRVKQYKKDMEGMFQCDYPNTPMFFPKRLFSMFTGANYSVGYNFVEDYDPFEDETEFIGLAKFTDFINLFWNKTIKKLMNTFPKH